jgi:hypothetical protein
MASPFPAELTKKQELPNYWFISNYANTKHNKNEDQNVILITPHLNFMFNW